MTTKHFAALAATVRRTPALRAPKAVTALLQFCHEQNPDFNAEKFLAACQPEPEPSRGCNSFINAGYCGHSRYSNGKLVLCWKCKAMEKREKREKKGGGK